MPDGSLDIARATADLAARLPPELAIFARLAFNLRWSWWPGAADLFGALDPEGWARVGANPIRLLEEARATTLACAAGDPSLLGRAAAIAAGIDAELGASPAGAPIALFCAEFALHRSVPGYAGGLGVLAGDWLKEASDRALPFVAIGLFYRQGYFHQRLDTSGWQHEYWLESDPAHLPVARVTGADGAPLLVSVPIGDHDVVAQLWRLDVGRVPLYLLDTDRPENRQVDRWITSRLYIGDRQLRLAQYLVLGVGGRRALRALGLEPRLLHLNEGHAALATLEDAAGELAAGRPFAQALALAAGRTVMTTHTPVAAGNETYGADEILAAAGRFAAGLGLEPAAFLALGRRPGAGGDEPFAMTVLALRASRGRNAVSARHGEVARAMWRDLWPDRAADAIPIGHVTNGVHLPTWMAPPMRDLLERHLGKDLAARAAEPAAWAGVAEIPDEELWAVRAALRARLVEYVRGRSVGDRLARGDGPGYAEAAARSFSPDRLTIGFARRLATYKRVQLLIHDPARALRLLAGPRALQIVIAGKAHPSDDDAKRVVQAHLFPQRSAPVVGASVAYLEDYDLSMAAVLVAGCDVWVNLPRPPLEASGTSGMKAALCGALELSVLDGWWPEGYDGENGWAIDSQPTHDTAAQDARDAAALYGLLESEILPLFHDRDASGIPRGWVRRIKRSLATLGPRFNTGRMLADYGARLYVA